MQAQTTAEIAPTITAEHVRGLYASPAMEPGLVWWLDTDEVDVLPLVLTSDISWTERDRPRVLILRREGGRWTDIPAAVCRRKARDLNRRAHDPGDLDATPGWATHARTAYPERFAASALTTEQAAGSLGITTATVRQQIASGALAAIKRGRDWHIATTEVERYRAERLGRVGRPRSR